MRRVRSLASESVQPQATPGRSRGQAREKRVAARSQARADHIASKAAARERRIAAYKGYLAGEFASLDDAAKSVGIVAATLEDFARENALGTKRAVKAQQRIAAYKQYLVGEFPSVEAAALSVGISATTLLNITRKHALPAKPRSQRHSNGGLTGLIRLSFLIPHPANENVSTAR